MRTRLFISFALVVLVSVIGVVVFARRSTTTAVRAFMYRGGMIGQGGIVQQLQDYYLMNKSWDGAADLLAGARRPRGQMKTGGMMHQRLRLADTDGTIVGDSTTPNPFGKLTRAEKSEAIPIQVSNQTVGYLVAEGGVALNEREEDFLVNRLTRAALTAGMIAAGLSLLLSILLAYRLIRPVRELTSAAQRLGEGDLSQRVSVKGGDELTVLAQAFNRMADSLQKAQKSRQSMTSDIAHELRNPLAVQRANLEAMQDGVYPLNPESLDLIMDQNLLLTRLVDDLRTLALADAGELKLQKISVEIVSLVERVVERFRPQADLQQVALLVDHPSLGDEELTLLVDPFRVEQIVNNLIANAMHNTPALGKIIITIGTEIGDVYIRVRDNGPGIPSDALPHIFERFYRADRARSRSSGGSGLGLAIARNLAEAHGGTLEAANHPAGGAIFTLKLPSGDI